MTNSNKRGSAADDIYNTFLNGGRKNNPQLNREVAIARMYERKLISVAANRFKWTNLPPEIDVRFMELTLTYQALSVFYYDKRYDKFFALRGGGYNYLDMENNPTAFTVVGNNFVSTVVSARKDGELARKAIPIWSNYMRTPDTDIIQIYAERLANFDRSVEINARNLRQPRAVAAQESQRLTAINLARQIDEGNNLIQVKQGTLEDLAAIKVLDLQGDPEIIEKLDIVRDRQWNKCMTLLGIDNANQDKKERLVSDEVSSNDDQTATFRYENLNSRRIAIEQINKYYNLDISVEYYTEEERRQKLEEEAAATDTGDKTEETDDSKKDEK